MKNEIIFRKKVSSGSRFNQIYVPKNFDDIIEVGDEVEVKLIKKQTSLYYSKNLKKISEFKENLVKNVFSELKQYKDIKICFVVGSFLTKIINYNDIDLIIISNELKNYEILKERLYNKLINKFNQNFHILFIQEYELSNLLEICPLTVSMFVKYISDKKTDLNFKRKLNKEHIKFLLMMPEDLLNIKVESKVFLDNIRRLITIERFLNKKNIDILDINKDVENLTNRNLYNRISSNDILSSKEINFIRIIMKKKIETIKEKLRKMKNGQEI